MSRCRSCEQPLLITLDPESLDEATSSLVGQGQGLTEPDDLLLRCGCHFHWQCLLEESPQIALDLACPYCQQTIVSTAAGPSATNSAISSEPQPQIVTRYHNEGGIQENLDILALITEEAYLDANPAARPARAFMTMCAEGDIGGIVELLEALEEEPDEGHMSPSELLRFQDPLDGMKTGLHVAIERSQQEAVWLLLWLASSLPIHAFPDEVAHAAESLEAGRETAPGVDIRGLKDEQGRVGEDVAGRMGNVWGGLLAAGILRT
ncbi:hypothetical protein WAI453_000460 [Rhynchosporium graminicola]|uniref:Uncharacterized protein n=1 Tax=Rhynchosporium graminicola TaxID=2792576 RepID=A0A1E1JQY6_9HELO|nr:uncharacterized protein RCO7_01032 [Rhynchosporium commune]